MQSNDPNYELLYYSLVLRAKIAIRDYFLKNVVREIYENSGQLLSLVRVQLANIQVQSSTDQAKQLSHSGELVGEVIRNLKEMSKSFFPEDEITAQSGIENALRHLLKATDKTSANPQIIVTGVPAAIELYPGLIYCHLVLDVTRVLTALYGEEALVFEITYSKTRVTVLVKYVPESGNTDAERKFEEETEQLKKLELDERVRMINGTVQVYNTQKQNRKIVLSMPQSPALREHTASTHLARSPFINTLL